MRVLVRLLDGRVVRVRMLMRVARVLVGVRVLDVLMVVAGVLVAVLRFAVAVLVAVLVGHGAGYPTPVSANRVRTARTSHERRRIPE